MTTLKRAIFTGSLSAGFEITDVVDDAQQAKTIVASLIKKGQLSEAIDVQLPSSIGTKNKDYSEGNNYVVFSNSALDGFTVFGPFPDDEESAEEFAEANRRNDEEWCVVKSFKSCPPGWSHADERTKELIENAKFVLTKGGKNTPFASYNFTICKTGNAWTPVHGMVKMASVNSPQEAASDLEHYWQMLPDEHKLRAVSNSQEKSPSEMRPLVYGYSINSDERGSFYADVRDVDGKSIFEIRSGSDLDENESSIFEDGYMSDKHDLDGLASYLCSAGLLPRAASLATLFEQERLLAEYEEDASEQEQPRG